MLTVAILINGHPILARAATNTGRTQDGKTAYVLDTGATVWHDPADGAIALAHALLDTIHEAGVERPHEPGLSPLGATMVDGLSALCDDIDARGPVALDEAERRNEKFLDNLELEKSCSICDGSSGWIGDDTGKWCRCKICNGSGYITTKIGERVLALMRHNFKPMLQDAADE